MFAYSISNPLSKNDSEILRCVSMMCKSPFFQNMKESIMELKSKNENLDVKEETRKYIFDSVSTLNNIDEPTKKRLGDIVYRIMTLRVRIPPFFPVRVAKNGYVYHIGPVPSPDSVIFLSLLVYIITEDISSVVYSFIGDGIFETVIISTCCVDGEIMTEKIDIPEIIESFGMEQMTKLCSEVKKKREESKKQQDSEKDSE